MKIVKCNYCKKEFKCEPWRIKKYKTLFCCKKCQYEYRKTNKYGIIKDIDKLNEVFNND